MLCELYETSFNLLFIGKSIFLVIDLVICSFLKEAISLILAVVVLVNNTKTFIVMAMFQSFFC